MAFLVHAHFVLPLYSFTFESMKVIINAKANPELKEALRIVAFEQKKSSSALMVSILEQDPQIAAKLLKLAKKSNR